MSVAPRPGPNPDRRVAPVRRRARRRRAAWRATRRRWLARLPVGPALLVAAAALTTASLRASPAELALDPSTAPVVVATVELAPGTVVDVDNLEVRTLPVVAVAPGSATTTDQVVGRQVTAAILPGEPVVESRLAPDGLLGVAAATPPSWSAFALPAGADLPDATVGQAVDLYALDATATTLESEAGRVARGALVVAIDDDHVTVAVRPGDAPAVASALLGSAVVVAITGPTAPAASADGP